MIQCETTSFYSERVRKDSTLVHWLGLHFTKTSIRLNKVKVKVTIKQGYNCMEKLRSQQLH